MKKQLFVVAMLVGGVVYGAAGDKRKAGNRLTGQTYLYSALYSIVKPGAIPELQTEPLKPIRDSLERALLWASDNDFDIVDAEIEDALKLQGAETVVNFAGVGKFPLSELIKSAQRGEDLAVSARTKAMLARVNRLLDQPAFREMFGEEESFKKLTESKERLEANDEQAGVRSLQQACNYLDFNPDKNVPYSPVGSSEAYPLRLLIGNIIQGTN